MENESTILVRKTLPVESQKYKSQQLNSLIESREKEKFSGVLTLKTTVETWQSQRTSVVIFNRGNIVYGGTKTVDNKEFAEALGKKFKPDLINAALSVAVSKLNNSDSVDELISKLVTLKVFTWKDVEKFTYQKVINVIEKFLPHPGIAEWRDSSEFDFSLGESGRGLDRLKLEQQLSLRQVQWSKLSPAIPSLYATPSISSESFKKVSDRRVKEHLLKFVNGRRTLVDIAEEMGKDPLTVAKSYHPWVASGWVSFEADSVIEKKTQAKFSSKLQQAATQSQPTVNSNLPMILSVDDSPIVQTSIKRALSDRYNVLLAGKATEALDILNQKPIKLVLLDLTMPDIDGLEFCKSIKQMPKFRNLPIVMVTARDGLVNKMKGHIAGTNKYLTKPFKAEELQAVVSEFVS